MEFLEIEFSDRYCKKKKITVPYTEIIAWEESYYESDELLVFTPITRTPIPGLVGVANGAGELEYLKWKHFLSRNK
jgi:hypothetical protein